MCVWCSCHKINYFIPSMCKCHKYDRYPSLKDKYLILILFSSFYIIIKYNIGGKYSFLVTIGVLHKQDQGL